jgi:hypothetical protein
MAQTALRLRHKILAWSSGGPTGDRGLAGDEQLGRCTAEQSEFYRLYLHGGNVALAATYLRRVRVVGRSSAAVATLAVILPGND